MRDDRPLASQEVEEELLETFPVDMSPEEYAARHSHLWATDASVIASLRYRDSRLDIWVRRVHDILSKKNGAPTVRELREQYLSPKEIKEAEQAERDF